MSVVNAFASFLAGRRSDLVDPNFPFVAIRKLEPLADNFRVARDSGIIPRGVGHTLRRPLRKRLANRGFSVPDAFGTNLHFLVSNCAGASGGVTPVIHNHAFPRLAGRSSC